MNKRIIVIVLLIALILPLFLFRKQVSGAYDSVLYYSPCDTPISYRIGTIDPEFEVTHEELLIDAKTAANIWNTTQNRQLFIYDPKSTFTINMVYDDRQKLTTEISDLKGDLEQKQSEIDPKITDFRARQTEFEKKMLDLNDRIKYWNEKGGAPEDEYEKLLTEQKQLQQEAKNLNNLAEELGQRTQEYNSNAKILNSTIDNFKQVLEVRPEEGLYEQEGGVRKISIYIDADQTAFLHTLAHEFGHALGIDHTDDPKSIMYPQTTNALTPSAEEWAVLDDICKKRTIFEVARNRFQVVLGILQDRMREVSN